MDINSNLKFQILEKIKSLSKIETKKNFWNITYNQGVFLSFFSNLYKPTNILELGTSNGYSTLFLLKELDYKINLTTIEIEKNRFEIAKDNLNFLTKDHNIELLNNDFFNNNLNLKKKYDLIFIDLCQSKYLEVLTLLEKRDLYDKKRFRIIFDNIITHKNNHEDLFNYIKKKYNYELVELDNGFLILYSLK
jgi:predicted O-methyltransferase YrrM